MQKKKEAESITLTQTTQLNHAKTSKRKEKKITPIIFINWQENQTQIRDHL